MDARSFSVWLDEAMAEDGWVQSVDQGEAATAIFYKIMRYVEWLRKARKNEDHTDPSIGNRKNSRN